MILNLNGENNTGALITELNNILSGFKSEINTMLTEFTNDINSDMTALSSEVVAMKGDIATVNSNVSNVKNDVATVSSKVSTMNTKVSSLGGAVKSVQRGTVTPTADEDMVINIKSVNPDKCLVLIHREKNEGSANFFAMPYELTSTTLKVTKSSYYYSGYQMVRFNWQVVEFY